MAATYVPDATDHGLSAEAQALDADRLTTEILVAEAVLGLGGTSFTDDDAERLKRAVALQVNLQVRLSSGAGSEVKSETRARQSITYATVNGQRVALDAQALSIAAAVLAPPRQSTVGEATFRW